MGRKNELKHYGVKGMKWKDHLYKTRLGSFGNFIYSYGNQTGWGSNGGNGNNGNNGNYGNTNNKSGSGANTYRAPSMTPVQQRNSRRRQYNKVSLSNNGSYGKGSAGIRTSAPAHNNSNQRFGVVGGKPKLYDSSNIGRMKRKERQAKNNRSAGVGKTGTGARSSYNPNTAKPRTDRRVTQDLTGDRRRSPMSYAENRSAAVSKTGAGARSSYKPTQKFNRSQRTDRRVTQNLSGDRRLSPMEIAANRARSADNLDAKRRRQNAQKAKNSMEVRAKTLNEALRNFGRSASANSPIGRQKLERSARGAATNTKIGTTLGVKSAAYKKRNRDEQIDKVLDKMQSNMKKHNEAVRRRRQIDNAKKWVASKLNDAGNFVNARKKDASNFINSLGKPKKKVQDPKGVKRLSKEELKNLKNGKKKESRTENTGTKGVKRLTESELKRLRKKNKKKKK